MFSKLSTWLWKSNEDMGRIISISVARDTAEYYPVWAQSSPGKTVCPKGATFRPRAPCLEWRNAIMAANRTQRYGLHLWEPGDNFLREEFNENFEALDAVPEAVTGTYTGDGASSQSITLGFQPRLVLVTSRGNTSSGYAAVAVPGGDGYAHNGGVALQVTEEGFAVFIGRQYVFTNETDRRYYYLAVR